jgi:hypothetical protein
MHQTHEVNEVMPELYSRFNAQCSTSRASQLAASRLLGIQWLLLTLGAVHTPAHPRSVDGIRIYSLFVKDADFVQCIHPFGGHVLDPGPSLPIPLVTKVAAEDKNEANNRGPDRVRIRMIEPQPSLVGGIFFNDPG